MDDETLERVRDVVRSIPPGETSSYGEVARLAGIPGRARLVGRILAEDGHDLPWHRVLRADGTCAPQIEQEQRARLRVEGVLLGSDARSANSARPDARSASSARPDARSASSARAREARSRRPAARYREP